MSPLGNFTPYSAGTVGKLPGPPGTLGTAGTVRTFGLRDVNQAAEDLAHARLQGEVPGAAGHGDDQVGRLQVPVLGQQLVQGFRVRVTGQSDILWGRGKASSAARVPTFPAGLLPREGARGAGSQLGRVPLWAWEESSGPGVWVPLKAPQASSRA